MFSQWNFSWSMGQFFGSAITHTCKKSEELPMACLYLKFSLGYIMLIHTYFCTKGYDYVKRFVRVLVLVVINTGCPKKLLKTENTALLISSSNYAKTPYVCTGGNLCSSFSNFFETPCMKVGFDVRISPV